MTRENYNLMWAIAILRDDMGQTWRQIVNEMGCSEFKCRYLYKQIKKEYKLL